MSEPLPISKLVALIGDENIQVQNVSHNMTAANNGKKMATITFATSPEHCQQMMRAAAGIRSNLVGLVLWFPADKLPTMGGGGVEPASATQDGTTRETTSGR